MSKQIDTLRQPATLPAPQPKEDKQKQRVLVKPPFVDPIGLLQGLSSDLV